MKTLRYFVPFLLLLAIGACSKDDQELSLPADSQSNTLKCGNRAIKIAVVSDLHLMNPSLLKSNGTAFQMYLMQDPKLLAESEAILQQIIAKLLYERPDLVLISGDLTKDGELVSHRLMIRQLQLLERNHIKVLVIPGNHDINNPDAKLFDGDNAIPVPSITPSDFAKLYADFGYKHAIARDPNSLSYVAEPIRGLRVIALDANEYYNNSSTYCVVAGHIKDGTMQWVKDQLSEANAKGKMVIGMMHHGLVEHFMGESVIFPDYLVDDWAAKADELAQAGLKVIFSGHFHANDAVQRPVNGLSIVDVETGSAVIYDSPYRIINLMDKKLYINTKHIERIFYPGLGGISFHDYEKAFTLNGTGIQAKYMLMNPPYSVPESVADQIAPVFAEAMLAHLAGDETISDEANAKLQAVYEVSHDLYNILLGLYTDLPPTDGSLVVNLN